MKKQSIIKDWIGYKKTSQTETLRKEVVSVFLYKEKMTLSVGESVIVGLNILRKRNNCRNKEPLIRQVK